jgi:hypothetical protein
MRNIKTFEDFMNANKSIDENQTLSRKPGVNFSNIVAPKTQAKIWESLYEAVIDAAKFESDKDPEHTLEGYLKETAMVMGSAAAKAMHSDDYFHALRNVSNIVVGENTSDDDYTSQRDDLKEYLDACVDSMKEEFCKKLDELKKTNHASATLVMKKIKEDNSQIYKQSKKI